jgi:hypothetical protein
MSKTSLLVCIVPASRVIRRRHLSQPLEGRAFQLMRTIGVDAAAPSLRYMTESGQICVRKMTQGHRPALLQV